MIVQHYIINNYLKIIVNNIGISNFGLYLLPDKRDQVMDYIDIFSNRFNK